MLYICGVYPASQEVKSKVLKVYSTIIHDYQKYIFKYASAQCVYGRPYRCNVQVGRLAIFTLVGHVMDAVVMI